MLQEKEQSEDIYNKSWCLEGKLVACILLPRSALQRAEERAV